MTKNGWPSTSGSVTIQRTWGAAYPASATAFITRASEVPSVPNMPPCSMRTISWWTSPLAVTLALSMRREWPPTMTDRASSTGVPSTCSNHAVSALASGTSTASSEASMGVWPENVSISGAASAMSSASISLSCSRTTSALACAGVVRDTRHEKVGRLRTAVPQRLSPSAPSASAKALTLTSGASVSRAIA